MCTPISHSRKTPKMSHFFALRYVFSIVEKSMAPIREKEFSYYSARRGIVMSIFSRWRDPDESSSNPAPVRKAVPLSMARGPYEYIPGDQESPVQLTSLADMLKWAQNWARSRSVWPLGYGLACCAIEMIAAAQSTTIFRASALRSSVPALARPIL